MQLADWKALRLGSNLLKKSPKSMILGRWSAGTLKAQLFAVNMDSGKLQNYDLSLLHLELTIVVISCNRPRAIRINRRRTANSFCKTNIHIKAFGHKETSNAMVRLQIVLDRYAFVADNDNYVGHCKRLRIRHAATSLLCSTGYDKTKQTQIIKVYIYLLSEWVIQFFGIFRKMM